jgi:NADP-dependent 3-hydroxy acid dehydrogenase YdfG
MAIHRVAFVTGSSAGIGRATALALAEVGMKVVVTARREQRLRELVDEVEAAGGVAYVVPGDMADVDDVARVWHQAAEVAGAVPTCVVANAGRGLQGGVTTSDTTQWASMVQLNLTATLHLMKTAAEAMVELDGPRDIVVLGSVVGVNVSPFSGVYGATKFAIGAAAEGLRRDVGRHGVRVTTIKPGIVESEFQGVAGYDEEIFGKVVAKFGAMLQPEDVARSIRFVVEQPANVHVNDLMLRPVGQDYP